MISLCGKKYHKPCVFARWRNNSNRPISKSELMKLEPSLTDFAVTNAKMYRGSWDTWSLHGTRSTETWWPSPGDFHRDVRHQNAEDLNGVTGPKWILMLSCGL